MRDSDIRDMLLNAEEPVSPGVWSAVAAGLDARKKTVVPAWLWGAVGFAAAAAVAAGVFLWHPQGSRLEGFESPLAALSLDYSLPQEIAMPSVSASTAVRGNKASIAPREEASLEAVHNATINPGAILKQTSRLAMPPKDMQRTAAAQDNYLLNKLAWEEKPLPGRDFSLTASGNIQAGSRANALSRRSAAAPASVMAEGVEYLSGDRPGVPFSAGIGIKWSLFPRWALGTGVRYTNLRRSFIGNYYPGSGEDGGWSAEEKSIDNMQHWVGIPLNLYFDFVSTPRWRVHAYAGGAVDYLLGNKFTIHSDKDIVWNKKGTSFQWSAGAGAGVEYLIGKNVGIYLDPGIRYYFGQSAGSDINGLPVHPVHFVVEAGVRFSIGSY